MIIIIIIIIAIAITLCRIWSLGITVVLILF